MATPYKFHYTVTGDAKHFPILFLHGFLGSSSDWQEVISFFADDYFCLALDLPGHGKTVVEPPEQNYGMERVASGLVEFLKSKDMRKWNVVAYSMGGRLALYMAVHYPDRFNRILLESASPGLEHFEERKLRLTQDMGLAERLEGNRLEDFLREWYEQPLFVSLKKNREKFDELFKRRMKNDKRGLSLSLKYMSTGAQPSLWHNLTEIKTPLCLIAGKEDAKFVGIAERMSRQYPKAKTYIIENAGHNVHFENVTGFVGTAKNFFLNE